MSIVLFDHPRIRRSLLPLTYTRPVADLRVGILTIREKWARDLDTTASFLTEEYLSKKFPSQTGEDNLYINGALFPTPQLLDAIGGLSLGEGIQQDGRVLACRLGPVDSPEYFESEERSYPNFSGEIRLLKNTWDIFLVNGEEIGADFRRLTRDRSSADLNDPHTIVYGRENLFLEPGVEVKAAIINADTGPVYIGADTEIQEGTIIQGPFAACEKVQLRWGGKMRPNTTLGPNCKVGGEVGNVIFQGNSNKAHEGFLGNSVIGAWCNLGADTNNSNLKNNYANVKVWDYGAEAMVDSGLQFCGIVMGDHSKCGINTMFNTGTVIGVNTNIFGAGFPPKFIPSFVWGAVNSSMEYDFQKSCETADRVMARRSLGFSKLDREIMEHVFKETARYRKHFLR